MVPFRREQRLLWKFRFIDLHERLLGGVPFRGHPFLITGCVKAQGSRKRALI
jgi:hypothetical protein